MGKMTTIGIIQFDSSDSLSAALFYYLHCKLIDDECSRFNFYLSEASPFADIVMLVFQNMQNRQMHRQWMILQWSDDDLNANIHIPLTRALSIFIRNESIFNLRVQCACTQNPINEAILAADNNLSDKKIASQNRQRELWCQWVHPYRPLCACALCMNLSARQIRFVSKPAHWTHWYW